MIRALALVCVVLVLMFQSGLMDTARISVRGPSFVGEGQYVRYMVRIDPRAENRLLVLAAVDESGPVRSTKEQLDGDSAPRTRWVEWKFGLPAGEYVILALLYSSQKEIARASVPVTVLSR